MMVFVTGLSRSGKSTAIEACGYRDMGFNYRRGSDILRDRGLPTADLTPAQSLRNQEEIVRALLSEQRFQCGATIFDGHLMIETTEGPQLVPQRPLEQLGIAAVINVFANADIVAERRGDPSIYAADISLLEEIETVCATQLARRTGSRLERVDSEDLKHLSVIFGEITSLR
ncbi:MAG: AAA family ATPase [Rhodospirillales bacterium]